MYPGSIIYLSCWVCLSLLFPFKNCFKCFDDIHVDIIFVLLSDCFRGINSSPWKCCPKESLCQLKSLEACSPRALSLSLIFVWLLCAQWPRPVWLSWSGHLPVHPKVSSSMPGQGTYKNQPMNT